MTTQPIGNVPTQEPFVDPDSGILSRVAARWLAKLLSLPEPFTTYTPVITAGAGTFTTVSSTGRYRRIGKLVFIQITVTITTNGTAASFIAATLPIAPLALSGLFSHILTGAVQNNAVGLVGFVPTSNNPLRIFKYDGSYPGADGVVLFLSGFYEIG